MGGLLFPEEKQRKRSEWGKERVKVEGESLGKEEGGETTVGM